MDKTKLVEAMRQVRWAVVTLHDWREGGKGLIAIDDAISYIQTVRDEVLDVEVMCRAYHTVRSQQGFTTAAWDKLEERNREQYREAMRAALKSTPSFTILAIKAMTDKVSTAPGWSDETLKKVGASLDDGHYNLGMCRSTYAALCCERERNAALSAEVERLKVERVHLAEFAWKHIGEDLMAMTPQEAVDAFDKSRAALGE